MNNAIENASAVKFQAAVAAVKLSAVPVMSTDRSIARKEQAALCRKLFSKLGLKGASVTAPNYSMAQSVRVSLPKLDWDDNGPNNQANRAADDKVCQILAIAFPNHDNRSDYSTDYFDYKWSIR